MIQLLQFAQCVLGFLRLINNIQQSLSRNLCIIRLELQYIIFYISSIILRGQILLQLYTKIHRQVNSYNFTKYKQNLFTTAYMELIIFEQVVGIKR